MKLLKLDYDWDWMAILIYDLSLLISNDYYLKIDDSDNIESILVQYYDYIIHWHRSSKCSSFNEVKDSDLNLLEEDASNNKRGLWQGSNPIPPWEFRKKKWIGILF